MNIYLVHAESTDRYKIGITTRSIEYRMKELNSSQSAYPLVLIKSIQNENYKAVERHLHNRYANNRVHGEWFIFSQNQLTEVQNYMQTFDTPLHKLKPILKPKSDFNLPNLAPPLKNWLVPVALVITLVYVCRNIEFFQPRQTHTPIHTHTLRKK